MANDKSASKQSSELRKRAEKALPKQAPQNPESTYLIKPITPKVLNSAITEAL